MSIVGKLKKNYGTSLNYCLPHLVGLLAKNMLFCGLFLIFSDTNTDSGIHSTLIFMDSLNWSHLVFRNILNSTVAARQKGKTYRPPLT